MEDDEQISEAIKRCVVDDAEALRTLAVVDRVLANPKFNTFSWKYGSLEFSARYTK